jgi:hypothetical protein
MMTNFKVAFPFVAAQPPRPDSAAFHAALPVLSADRHLLIRASAGPPV